jgi:CIC family chloride channel protein
VDAGRWAALIGSVTDTRRAQALLADETLEQALRQLTLYGRVGLPVLSADRHRLTGWITRRQVLRAMTNSFSTSAREAERGAIAAEFGDPDPHARVHTPSSPLSGYAIVEISVGATSPALGRRLDDVILPPGCLVVAVTEGRELIAPRPDVRLAAGERLIVLAAATDPGGASPAAEVATGGADEDPDPTS